MKLSAKQKAFADAYIENPNNEYQAAIKAGYSPAYARGNAYKMVENSGVAAYIAERTAKIESEKICSLQEIQEFRSRVVRGEEKDQFDLDVSMADRLKSATDLEKSLQIQRAEREKREAEKVEREIQAQREARKFDIPARLVAKEFVDIHRDILAKGHTEYMLKGGRGSTKSSFIALEIVALIKNNPDLNAVVLRKIGNTLRNSVYNTILWAISAMELDKEFSAKLSPMEVTYKPTGQTIYFFGLDDPLKLKSIKPKVGYCGILWYEELDQFAGDEECRSVRQSVIRGGDEAYVFKSFNPPKSKNNWANMEADIPKDGRLVSHTDYLSVPEEWLGQAFLDEAEDLKELNPTAYEHEYLGYANGNGGMVFENVVAETITKEQIHGFDRVLCGVDWGYYPDPWAFNQMHFDAARRTLYIYGELTAYKCGNRQTADMLESYGIKKDQLITADSAEPKSVADYRDYGLFCRGANKGPGSVDYSMKWLQSLVKIVIDPVRCPDTYEEFVNYEYERTKDGEIMSGYPDANNHHIDAVRYATEDIWKWKGQ